MQCIIIFYLLVGFSCYGFVCCVWCVLSKPDIFLKTVVRVSRGILSLKYFCSNKAFYLWQQNCMVGRTLVKTVIKCPCP